MSSSKLFTFLVVSLMFSSFIIAGMTAFKEQSDSITGYITPPYLDDYSDKLEFNQTCSDLLVFIHVYIGNWSCSSGSLIAASDRDSSFYLPYSAEDNGFYNVTYYIDNNGGNTFYINVRESTFANSNDIKISFESDKIRIPNNVIWSLSDKEISKPTLFNTDSFIVNTRYSDEDHLLNLTVNGEIILSKYETNVGLPFFTRGFNGVGTLDGDVIVNRIDTKTSSTHKEATTDASIFSALTNIWGMVALIILYNIDGVELWVNFLFIKTQLAGVIIAGLAMLRGV